MRVSVSTLLCLNAVALTTACDRIEVGSPYENVDWQTFSHFRADLHVHTLQSDGCHLLDEVVRVYRELGFSILAITDHDAVSPNLCPTREDAGIAQIDFGLFADQHSPYPNPQPDNFPANTTWPWTDFGAPSPAELGMVGIEGAELTCGHHISSYFSDYGVPTPCSNAPTENEWLSEIARRGGLASVNHPVRDAEERGLDWYSDLYREHSGDHLVGIEISGDGAIGINTALWDQLLGEFMPNRPIWGISTSDMHLLVQTRFAFTVLLLDELTSENVKRAMISGQFYAVTGPGEPNLSTTRRQESYAGPAAYEGTYPELQSIVVDRDAGEISITASGYDEILWISRSSSRVATTDVEAATLWPSGQIVQRGPVLNYANGEEALPYVRAEIIRLTEAGPIRLFVNPIALTYP